MGSFESVVMRSLWRIAKGITGEKIPMLAGHKLLYTCNLRCHMCPFWRRPDEVLLTLDEEKKMMNSLADFGVSFMGFEGGEPFLRRDLPEILSYSRKKFYTSLVSNGWALKEKISQVKDSLDHLFISIDGIGETHDRLRGMEGSYRRAVEGIEAASRYVPVSLSSTITSENCQEVEQIVDLARTLGVTVSLPPGRLEKRDNELPEYILYVAECPVHDHIHNKPGYAAAHPPCHLRQHLSCNLEIVLPAYIKQLPVLRWKLFQQREWVVPDS